MKSQPDTNVRDLRDFVDSLEEEWLAEVPDLHTDGIPVVARLVRMSYYIARRVDENLARFGLNRGEFEVLAVLTRNPGRTITPKILQEKILISSGGLSNRIKKLEEKGLLVRRTDPEDRRGVILEATEAGRELTLRAVTSHVEVERQIVGGISPEHRATLARLLKELILTQVGELNRDGLQ